MNYAYANRKRSDSAAPQKETAAPQPSLDALRTGAAVPTQEQLGHRVDLPDAMREKMESAFGADLSAVKLYESQAVADVGSKAITQGSNIAFAPGMLDFTSYGGQALLGHEISHVVSQARDEVTGGGFLNDYSLEARADREGAMAAAGEQIAMPTASLSPVTAAAASGPMQASKATRKVESARKEQAKQILAMVDLQNTDPRHGTESKAYHSAQRRLQRAKNQESNWFYQLSREDKTSVGETDIVADRVLDSLNLQAGGINNQYLQNARLALNATGGGRNGIEMQDRLSTEVAHILFNQAESGQYDSSTQTTAIEMLGKDKALQREQSDITFAKDLPLRQVLTPEQKKEKKKQQDRARKQALREYKNNVQH